MKLTIRKQIDSLRSDGVRICEIADVIGYSHSYVYKVARDYCEPSKKFKKAFYGKYNTESIVTPYRKNLVHQKENDQLKMRIAELEAKLESINAIINR